MQVQLSASYIRKILAKHGYKWLPRSQKRKYDDTLRAERVDFAKKVLSMSTARLRARLSLAMDGVILTMPPANPIDRWNYCRYGEDKVYRKPQEACDPRLAGNDKYGKQAPVGRCAPMWGGICAG